MKLAIVEDEKEDKTLLVEMAGRWAKEQECSLDITSYNCGESFLTEYIPGMFDLIFMDIFMSGMNGIETVKQLRQKDNQALIVFLTSSEEYIFHATPLHIFDYVQKPYSYHRLSCVLNELVKVLPGLTKKIEFACGTKNVALEICHILYIVANNNDTIFTMSNDVRKYRIFFSKIADLLEDQRFLTCTRGVILNMDYIQLQERDVFVMSDGRQFPIRRNGRKQIIEAYEHYQFFKLDNI